MCGRFVEYSSISKIKKAFDIDGVGSLVNTKAHQANYNISPGQNVLSIVNNNDERILTNLRWGLIPRWADDERVGYRMINARAETLLEKRTFKDLFQNKRCLVVADGFYEWEHRDKEKIPHYFSLKSKDPFAMAGLYEVWQSPEQRVGKIISCTIITTKANKTVKKIHDRMPAIIKPDDYGEWLDCKNYLGEVVQELLEPIYDKEMTYHEVSKKVNYPKNNSVENIASVNRA